MIVDEKGLGGLGGKIGRFMGQLRVTDSAFE